MCLSDGHGGSEDRATHSQITQMANTGHWHSSQGCCTIIKWGQVETAPLRLTLLIYKVICVPSSGSLRLPISGTGNWYDISLEMSVVDFSLEWLLSNLLTYGREHINLRIEEDVCG